MTFEQNIAIFIAKYLIFILLAVAGVWFLIKTPKALRREFIIFALSSMAFTFVLSLLASKLYFNPRPFVVGHFTPLIDHSMNNGFPFNHTLLSAAVASVVFRYSRIMGFVLFGLTLMIGLSGVYAGVHHLVDVLGSIFIATLSTLIVYFVTRNILAKAE